jgi:hypothetical protein
MSSMRSRTALTVGGGAGASTIGRSGYRSPGTGLPHVSAGVQDDDEADVPSCAEAEGRTATHHAPGRHKSPTTVTVRLARDMERTITPAA